MRPRRVCRGNSPHDRARIRAARGFNEAPACLPGKLGSVRWIILQAIYASMRPRRVCRGNSRIRPPSFQSRRSFNEAPACLPGKRVVVGVASRCDSRLQ